MFRAVLTCHPALVAAASPPMRNERTRQEVCEAFAASAGGEHDRPWLGETVEQSQKGCDEGHTSSRGQGRPRLGQRVVR